MLTLYLTQIGQFKRAEGVINDSIKQFQDPGNDAIEAAIRATIRLAEGRFADAVALADDSLHRKDSGASSTGAHAVIAAASLRQCDLRSATHHARMLTEASFFGQLEFFGADFGQLEFFGADVRLIVAQVIEADRGREAAERAAVGVANSILFHGDLLISAAAPWLVRLMLSSGNRQMAQRIVEATQVIAAGNEEFQALQGAVLHAVGLLHGRPEYLLRAAKIHVYPWIRASAWEDAGVILATEKREHCKAIAALEQAMNEYHALGAALDLTRVKSRLHKLGSRYHYARWSVQPPVTHRNLTDTESRIVCLVSQGLTNVQVGRQMHLSQHTVAFHLKRIFKKLSVSTRGELTSVWFKQSGQQGDLGEMGSDVGSLTVWERCFGEDRGQSGYLGNRSEVPVETD